MPKGEKNDGFDGAKFEDWIVGFQQLFRRVVEEEKSVEGQRYRKVVHQRDIKISGLGTETGTKMGRRTSSFAYYDHKIASINSKTETDCN